MKKLLLKALFFLLIVTVKSYAQPTTAYDFKMNDCNGQMHHLFNELDSGNVVIMEFFMLSCSPCIDAGDTLEVMYQDLKAQYGNKIRFYHFAYTNSYTCTQVKNWVNTNGYSSVPFDSGAVQVAYYEGMGMPTTAIVAGSAHKVLFTKVGFSTSDTTIIAGEIRKFLDSTAATIKHVPAPNSFVSVYPNPASSHLNISIVSAQSGTVHFELMNLEGKKISDLWNEKIPSGSWNKIIPLGTIAEGFYLLRGEINNELFFRKISIIQ